METVNTRSISILEPVGDAISKTRQILFAPFNFEKWLVIGFCAWLAGFNGLGGGLRGFNFADGSCKNPPNISQMGHEIRIFVMQNLPWLLPVAAAGIVLMITIGLLVTWLKSRGQFMFLDCIARNRAAVSAPWTQYGTEGNSLFGFKLILWLAGSFLMLAAIVPVIFIIVVFARTDFKAIEVIPAVIAAALVFAMFLIGLAFGVIRVLTDDFIVPIMYRRRCGVKAAWKELKELLSARPAIFFLYLLFLIVVNMVIGFLAVLCGLTACCCFCCVSWAFFIPLVGAYLMAVLLLPLAVWRRSYAVFFLSQFGPEYNVFETVTPPAELIPAAIQIAPLHRDQNPQSPPPDGLDI